MVDSVVGCAWKIAFNSHLFHNFFIASRVRLTVVGKKSREHIEMCVYLWMGLTSYKTKCLLIAFYLKFSHSLSRRIAEEWFSSGERFIRDRLENKNQYQSLFQTFYTAFVGALHSIFHRLCIVYNFILTQPLLSFPHMCGLCYYWLSVWIVRIYILLYSFRSIQSNRGNTCDRYTSDINHNEIENHFMRRKRMVLNCK